MERDSSGNYLAGIGSEHDPLNVFSVVELEGEPVIRVSGEVIGHLITRKLYSNYHLRLKFKWGDIKWEWMEGRPKDGGILYHRKKLPSGRSVRQEFQIHEGDVGSYWAKHTVLDFPARYTTDLPKSILQARPFLRHLVSTLTDTMLIFDAKGQMQHFDGEPVWQICNASPLNENPHGEWNELELICYENHAVHIVNGQVNFILLNGMGRDEDGQTYPMDTGSVILQSEGADIFFKDLYIEPVDEMPEVLHPYFP